MSSTVGQQLRQAREARSLTIEEVAQTTRIRAHYLKAMEAGEFDTMPSTAQVRGFVRSYAGFLNLDANPLLAALSGEAPPPTAPQPTSAPKRPPEIPAADSSPEQATLIFTEVGQSLQRQRELLGLSLDDIERHIHLRQHYLKALEAGDLERLPSPVQGRGMLNNYAVFLGLDPEPLLLRFADGLQARLAASRAASPAVHSTSPRRKPLLPTPLRRLISIDILIGIAVAFFLLLFTVWGAIRIFAMTSEQEPTPTAPSIADVLLASPTATTTHTPEPPTATIPAPPQVFPTPALATDSETGNPVLLSPQEGLQVYVTVRQRAWMRATVDGEVEFEGRVLPGSAYPFVGESQIEIQTGNGAALQVFFNGIDLGVLGTFGQVVSRIYAQEGIITPTPSHTPTETTIPLVTSTPIETATPVPGGVTAPANP